MVMAPLRVTLSFSNTMFRGEGRRPAMNSMFSGLMTFNQNNVYKITNFPGGWGKSKKKSDQLKLKLPTGAELGNTHYRICTNPLTSLKFYSTFCFISLVLLSSKKIYVYRN